MKGTITPTRPGVHGKEGKGKKVQPTSSVSSNHAGDEIESVHSFVRAGRDAVMVSFLL
jgi:hypothetical protein